eukprot:4539888-Pleurochrysis_carterae.AAC.1
MLEAEYNEVADKHVPNTQAGWTEDRMATEHSLTFLHECKSRGAMGSRESDGSIGYGNLDHESTAG